MSDEPWWNTSARLKGHFPGIEKGACWQRFAQSYDKEECRDRRRRSWEEAHPPKKLPDGSLEMLEDLAMRAAGRWSITHLLARGGDPVISKAIAGEKLGKIVLKLISDRREFASLEEQIQLRDERPVPNRRNIADAIEAFVHFIKRTGKLPTNKQIRVEANRMKWAEWSNDFKESGFEFGRKLKKGDQIYQLFSCDPDVGGRVVPLGCWDQPRWDEKTFSVDVTKPAGFSGLPRR